MEKELTKEIFLRRLVAALTHEVNAVTGQERLREVVSLAGLGMSEEMERAVRVDVVGEAPKNNLIPKEIGEVLVELKRRIDGDFYVEEVAEDRIVLENRRCPFGQDVEDRPSLCMMTSSVFGGIASRHAGYARVDLEKAIARGDTGCRVIVHLKRGPEPLGPWSHEYVSDADHG